MTNKSTHQQNHSSSGPLKVAITGSRGFIGRGLTNYLSQNNYKIIAIERSLLYDDNTTLQNKLKGIDIVLNLAGASINQRWNKKNKQTIYDSRIKTTNNLVKAINSLNSTDRPKHLLSVSAIGIYKNDLLHNETSQHFDKGFLGTVVKDWEEQLQQVNKETALTIFRLGIVIGANAKIVQQLSPIFKLGLGGRLGSGKQAFPFIFSKDVFRAFHWAITENKTGTYNLCTPQTCTNKDFTTAFGKAVNRPTPFIVPSIFLKLAFGKMAIILLKSPKVNSQKIQDEGYSFTIQTIEEALINAL